MRLQNTHLPTYIFNGIFVHLLMFLLFSLYFTCRSSVVGKLLFGCFQRNIQSSSLVKVNSKIQWFSANKILTFKTFLTLTRTLLLNKNNGGLCLFVCFGGVV